MSKPRSGEATPRRDFLRTLVLTPAAAAAVAGCATPHPTATPREDTPAEAPAAGAAAPAGGDPGLRALRGVPLDLSAEPAFVFRAASARPGE